jgi:hypothetical protein
VVTNLIKRVRDWIVILFGIVFSIFLCFLIWGGVASYRENPTIRDIVFISIFGILLLLIIVLTSRKIIKMNRITANITSEGRNAIPRSIRDEIYQRARNACENPDCRYNGTVHIHHIDMNNRNNSTINLIALCPNCHQDAHKGIITTSQLRNWSRIIIH